MQKVLVIVGQTAVGKTSLSIKLAKALNGQIINGDAMQVYKELNIITDKISLDKTEGIPHHLFNIKSINEDYSVEEYQRNIKKVIAKIASEHALPIIVGGTGLYVKAALTDYTFSKQDISNKEMEEKYKDYDNDQLYEYLKKIDEKSTLTIHKNNRRRVLRAIAIYEATGCQKSKMIEKQKHEFLYDVLLIGLTLEKDLINQKIDERIDEMFENGVVEEVLNNPTTNLASKAIGYKEITTYLNGDISLNEAKQFMKIHTHQFAKRQRTWFKNQFDVNWVYNDDKAFDIIMDLVNQKWNNKKDIV